MRNSGDDQRELAANKLLDEADILMQFSGEIQLLRAGLLVGFVRYRLVSAMGDGSERERVEARIDRIMARIPGWNEPRVES